MTQSKLIVIGGSAGAIPSVMEIMRGLPADFPIPMCVVIHFHPDTRSVLPMLLESSSGIPAKHPQTQEVLLPRSIYVAPPDHHMVIHKNRILLHRGPPENRYRPAINTLFRTAAASFGPAVIGILLSGYLDDGSEGLLAIKKEGGRIIIQDPADTAFHDMPRHALDQVQPDYLVRHKDIAAVLMDILREAPPIKTSEPDSLHTQNISHDSSQTEDLSSFPLLCDHPYPAYRDRLSLNEALQSALWSAVRALDEKVALNRRLMQRAEELHQILAVRKYRKLIDCTEAQILTIRRVLDRSMSAQRMVGDLE